MTALDAQTAEQLRLVVREQEEHIAMLRRRIEHLEAQERELRAARDELASRLEEEHGEEAVERRGHEARIVDLTDEVRSLNRTIRMMQSTKVWQLGERYWAVRDAAKRLLGRA